jgi:putative oxidoreductase
MKTKAPIIAGAILGLLFIVFGLNFFLKFLPTPPSEEGTPGAAFIGAMYGSGFLALVKVLEILGGILVAIPKTRNFGLLVLGPIIINILAFNFFFTDGGLFQPPVILIAVLSAYLLWSARNNFAKLIN